MAYKRTKKAEAAKKDLDSFIDYFTKAKGKKPSRLILSKYQMANIFTDDHAGPRLFRAIPCVRESEAMAEHG